jgi:hypothetical protein
VPDHTALDARFEAEATRFGRRRRAERHIDQTDSAAGTDEVIVTEPAEHDHASAAADR